METRFRNISKYFGEPAASICFNYSFSLAFFFYISIHHGHLPFRFNVDVLEYTAAIADGESHLLSSKLELEEIRKKYHPATRFGFGLEHYQFSFIQWTAPAEAVYNSLLFCFGSAIAGFFLVPLYWHLSRFSIWKFVAIFQMVEVQLFPHHFV